MKKRIIMVMASGVCALAMFAQTPRPITIAQLFELIDNGNIELKVTQTVIDAAQEGVSVAKNGRLPDIDAQASVSYNGNALLMSREFRNIQGLSSPHFGNSLTLNAQQVIYTGGALSAGIRMAELGVRQAELQHEQTRQDVRMMALGQYLDLQKIAHREEVVVKNIDLVNQLIGHINERHAQGVALKNDITRYELQLQTLQLKLTQLRNTRTILNHQLCNTLGLSLTDSIIPTDDTARQSFALGSEEAWQDELTAVNPQLQMAQVGEKMAIQQEKIAHSDRLPKISVVAANNFNGPITYELPPVDKNINVWYVGVGVKYSLSSIYKTGNKQRQTALQTRQAHENRTAVAERLNNQMQAAYTNYLQSYVELETQQKSVKLAQENYTVMSDRYENQLVLVTDMIDASNMKLDAELNEVDARINIAYAYYKMMYVAGKL